MEGSLTMYESVLAIMPPLRPVLTQEACALLSKEPTSDFSTRVSDVSCSLCRHLFTYVLAHTGTHT